MLSQLKANYHGNSLTELRPIQETRQRRCRRLGCGNLKGARGDVIRQEKVVVVRSLSEGPVNQW